MGLGWSATRLSTWVTSSLTATLTSAARSTSQRWVPRVVARIQPARAAASTANGTGRKSELLTARTVPIGGGGSFSHRTTSFWAASAPGCSASQ